VSERDELEAVVSTVMNLQDILFYQLDISQLLKEGSAPRKQASSKCKGTSHVYHTF
jgi:hypothetical protein